MKICNLEISVRIHCPSKYAANHEMTGMFHLEGLATKGHLIFAPRMDCWMVWRCVSIKFEIGLHLKYFRKWLMVYQTYGCSHKKCKHIFGGRIQSHSENNPQSEPCKAKKSCHSDCRPTSMVISCHVESTVNNSYTGISRYLPLSHYIQAPTDFQFVGPQALADFWQNWLRPSRS